MSDNLHAASALLPRKEPPVPWVGPRAGLYTVAKRTNPIIFPAGNRMKVVQPVA